MKRNSRRTNAKFFKKLWRDYSVVWNVADVIQSLVVESFALKISVLVTTHTLHGKSLCGVYIRNQILGSLSAVSQNIKSFVWQMKKKIAKAVKFWSQLQDLEILEYTHGWSTILKLAHPPLAQLCCRVKSPKPINTWKIALRNEMTVLDKS